MALLEDYAGPFVPDAELPAFSRQALAVLGREYLLNGHLQDRVGLPLVAKQFGGNAKHIDLCGPAVCHHTTIEISRTT